MKGPLLGALLLLGLSFSGWSQTSFQDLRNHSHHSVQLGYEVLTTWIPFKWTASYTYTFNSKWSFELEYARGKVGLDNFGFDIASVRENRYSLLARRYVGNSFHWIFGFYKNDLRAKLGDDILDDMSDTSIDDVKVSGLGVSLGLGNRWQWKNGFILGMDWVRMSIPLFDKKVDNDALNNIEDDNDLSRVRDGLQKFKNVPTFILLGLKLGYSF